MRRPNGYEGQGPEHSAGRMERFLLLCAEDNIQVGNATTSAQFFHLLRRQMHQEVRRLLVVFTPKSLLRAMAARSGVSELTQGSFEEELLDPAVESGALAPPDGRRVVFAAGKVAEEGTAVPIRGHTEVRLGQERN